MTIYYGKCVKGEPCWVGTMHYEVQIDLGSIQTIKAIRVKTRVRRISGSTTYATMHPRWFRDDWLGKYDTDWTQIYDEFVVKTLYETEDLQYFGMLSEAGTGGSAAHADLDYLEIWASTTGDLPPEVLIPGHKFCMDGHLYEVTEDGTGYFLIESDAAICQPVGECPDFWVDPVGAVVCWILAAFEAAIGLVAGGFYVLLLNVSSFLTNFAAIISDFFSDLVGNIQAAMAPIILGITSWLDTAFNNIGEWWDSIVLGIGEWWNSTTEEVGNWWTSLTGDLGEWWTSFWEDPIGVIQSYVGSVIDFTEAVLLEIWEGIQGWVVDLITDLIASFNAGFDQGIEDQKNLRNEEEE
jgi:hypothetical protein